ncbi:MAG: tetratricopeptide repeat protein [Bacteroidia bacterium]|nr:tetratricopeptide repeat protein [Bacteroidia bacterium]
MRNLWIWTLSFCCFPLTLVFPKADSLIYALHQAEGMEKQAILLKLSTYYAPDSFDLALGYVEEAKKIAEGNDDQQRLAQAYLQEGYLWESYSENISDIRKAIQPVQIAKNICLTLNDTACLAQASFAIARLYARFELIDRAAPYFFEALQYFRILKDTSNLIQVNLALAQVYKLTGDPGQAINYSISALDLAQTSEQDSLRALIMFFIGEAYLEKAEYPQALSYLKEAINELDNIQNISYKTAILNRTGETYRELRQMDKCFMLHNEALELARQSNDAHGMADSYYGIADAYVKIENYSLCLIYLDSSTFLAEQVEFNSQLLKNYQKYITVFLRTDQYEKFMHYHNKSQVLEDKIDQENKDQILLKVQTFYESERMERELAFNEAKLELSAAQLKNSRTQAQFAILAGIFLAFLLAIFFRQYQTKKRANEELEEKVAIRTRELRTAYGEVVLLNEELDTFAYRTTHDIRGPVARLLGLSQIAMNATDKAEASTYMDLIYKEAISMDFMLHRFLEVNKIKHITPLKQPIELEKMIRDVWESLADIDGFREIELIIAPSLPQYINSDIKLSTIVFRNLLENTIVFRSKETKVKPFVKITSTENGNGARIHILDNGIGIRPEVATRVFEMFFRGTNASTGLGLGLYATKLAAEKMEVQIYYRADNHTLTEFEIVFPII